MHRLLLTAFVVLGASNLAFAQVKSIPTEPVAVVREYIAAQNRGDINRMLSFLADRVEIRVGVTDAAVKSSAVAENPSQLRVRFSRIAQTVPNARTEVLELMSDGSLVITKERTTGLPGNSSDTGLAMYRVHNGKIDTLWALSSSSSSGDR
jgi:hypothetical protein